MLLVKLGAVIEQKYVFDHHDHGLQLSNYSSDSRKTFKSVSSRKLTHVYVFFLLLKKRKEVCDVSG